MTHTEAERLLGVLAGGTSGWSSAPDETFQVYLYQFGQMADTEAAFAAVTHIIETWGEARRPPVSAIRQAYQQILVRRAMERPALVSRSPEPVTLEQGRLIAARAYRDECAKRPARDPHVLSGYRTTAPSARTLNALLGSIGSE